MRILDKNIYTIIVFSLYFFFNIQTENKKQRYAFKQRKAKQIDLHYQPPYVILKANAWKEQRRRTKAMKEIEEVCLFVCLF